MSGSAMKILDPIGAMLHKDDNKKDDAPPAETPATAPVANDNIAARTDDFAALQQDVGERASAAGAQRSDNEADLLGYVKPKKRSASRAILG